MTRNRPFQTLYVGLWLVRISLALWGTGYIHPDEHMQNGEVTAGSILGFHALSTWEWQPDSPVRSVVPPFMTAGLPMLVLGFLFGTESRTRTISPLLLFHIERSVYLGLTALLDFSASNLVSSPTPRRLCLLLLASSYVTYTFQVRPFSNSLESVLLALCLVLLRRLVDTWHLSKAGAKSADDRDSDRLSTVKRDLHLLAILAVVGIFTRPTFFAFSLPIAYQVLSLAYRATGSAIRTAALLLPAVFTAALTAIVFIAADTYHFRGNFSEPIITPYNFIKYNLSAQNLADHGLHPHWLHVGVNLPMLLGPLLVWFAFCGVDDYLETSRRPTRRVHFETDVLRQTIIQIVVVSLSILSVQPHQEPRFLTPLVLPIIVLAATSKLPPPPGKLFWASWVIFNTALALVFGVLHQGGVVPSLLSLHSTLKNAPSGTSTQIVYWKTYMPPRHLLGIPEKDVLSGRISFIDLAGTSQDGLMTALSAPAVNTTYLVTPLATYLTLPEGISSCTTLKKRIFPHLDLDHIPESIQTGWPDGLSIGIYAIERGCVADGQTMYHDDERL